MNNAEFMVGFCERGVESGEQRLKEGSEAKPVQSVRGKPFFFRVVIDDR